MLQYVTIVIACVLVEHIVRNICVFFNIIEISYNSGAAFGLFREVPEFTTVLSAFACCAIVCVLVLGKLNQFSKIGFSIMLGGALSNLAERVFLGHVIDWIPFLLFDLNFNLADVQISVGAFIAFICSI